MSDDVDPPSRRGEGGAATGWSQVLAVVVGVGLLAGGWWMSRERALTIFVVSMDTTRPDHLSAYGYESDTTPTLARLAREGTVFTHARTSAPWTLPSHMSLFTGLSPDLHGVMIDFHVLDASRPTLGTVFHDAGFDTVGMFTAPYVHPRYGFGRGFDFYERCTQEPMLFDLPERNIDAQAGVRELLSHKEVTSKRAVGSALRRFTVRPTDRNLYFLHLFDPHYDYRAPADVKRLFVDPRYDGPITGEDLMLHPELLGPDMPDDDRRALLANYDAEIRWVDDNLARVLERIEQEELVGRAMVVVVADHGESFFENGRFGHRLDLREEVLRIPMIFWGPGIVPEGRTIDDNVALYDVLPTLMDYAGIALPEDGLYGQSLRPLMEGGSLPARCTVSSLTFLSHDADALGYLTRHDSWVSGDLKLVRRLRVPWSKADPTNITNPPLLDSAEFDVFDLASDPGERVDLHDRDPNDPRVLAVKAAADLEDERQRRLAEALGSSVGVIDRDPQDLMTALGYFSPVDQANQTAMTRATTGDAEEGDPEGTRR